MAFSNDMFSLGLPIIEKIVRPIIVYVFLVALLRIFGKRELAQLLIEGFRISERRSCGLVGVDRSSFRYVSRFPEQEVLRGRLKEMAATRLRFGYRRLCILLRREGEP